MIFKIHQTLHTIADFEATLNYLKSIDLNVKYHLLPELFLTGYPLQDLCLDKSFIENYQSLLKEIEKWAKKSLGEENQIFLGGLDYKLSKSGLPERIENCIFKVSKNGIENIYTKQLLPNYDIFEEKKYFAKGKTNTVIEIENKRVAFLICEDMWSSSIHDIDPVSQLKKEKQLDLVINLSASPFNLHKAQKRFSRAKDISNFLKCPFIYVNRVGAEDEILFDGQSFVQQSESTIVKAPIFEAHTFDYELSDSIKYEDVELKSSNTWEQLFNPRLDEDLKIQTLSDESCHEILEALKFGFREYARKSSFNNFTIALSGGIDSALVLTIIRLALEKGQYLEAIYMPSIHSSTLSYDLSFNLCKNLGVPLSTLPIKFLHSTTKNLFGQTFNEPFEGLTDENIQSRLRGTLLYTRSNQINSMVVNTSNKSELAVGYSTQYGDSVGAISLLGDLYKSEVFRLTNYINKIHPGLIPQEIITRPPSAELRADQEDSQTLPEYEILDSILESILSNKLSKKDLLKNNFKEDDIDKVLNFYKKTEFKRYQFCPIIKLTSKSFGFGYRIPINKNSNFYTN